jgi:hypothetical protein
MKLEFLEASPDRLLDFLFERRAYSLLRLKFFLLGRLTGLFFAWYPDARYLD